MLYCTVTTISCYETNSECVLLWCVHTQWLARNHVYAIITQKFYAVPWIPSRKMSRGSLVMNYSWVKTAPFVVSSFLQSSLTSTVQRFSVQAVDDVGYSLAIDLYNSNGLYASLENTNLLWIKLLGSSVSGTKMFLVVKSLDGISDSVVCRL